MILMGWWLARFLNIKDIEKITIDPLECDIKNPYLQCPEPNSGNIPFVFWLLFLRLTTLEMYLTILIIKN